MANNRSTISRSWRVVWPFAGLCLLGASRWFLEGGLPQLASTNATEATGCLMVAGLFYLAPVFRGVRNTGGERERVGTRAWWRISASSLILTAPALVRLAAGSRLNANNATLALALTPVVAAVAMGAAGSAETADLTGRLWPGLAGLAGMLLLLPQPNLGDVGLMASIAALPVLMGLAAMLASDAGTDSETSKQPPNSGQAAVYAGGALLLAAAVFAVLAIPGRSPSGTSFSLGAAVYDGSLAGLTLLALHRLGPLRWSGQFLLIPLLTLLEGAALLHPVLDARSWLGLGLMAASGIYLLLG